jgi:high-affinity iron transporter
MIIPKHVLALLSLVSLLGLWVLAPAHNAAAQTPSSVNVSAEIAAIDDLLQQSMYAYQHGDKDKAFKLSRAAYLDHFENIEIPLRVMDADLTSDMEFRFADLRTLMQQGAPADQVEAKARSVRSGLDEVDRLFGDGPGVVAPMFALVTSFSIIFREGLEAALVVAAVLVGIHGLLQQVVNRGDLGADVHTAGGLRGDILRRDQHPQAQQ